jgi:DNA invertase Pin-like site-specific DNA recombinase
MSGGEHVLGYARAGEGVSLEAQRAAIAAACARRDWKLLRLLEDASGEGKNGRPGFARALESLHAGKAQALVVARLDRLAGSLSEAARLLERARGEGWDLVALDLGLDRPAASGASAGPAQASVPASAARARPA